MSSLRFHVYYRRRFFLLLGREEEIRRNLKQKWLFPRSDLSATGGTQNVDLAVDAKGMASTKTNVSMPRPCPLTK